MCFRYENDLLPHSNEKGETKYPNKFPFRKRCCVRLQTSKIVLSAELHFIINSFWQRFLSGCNNMKAAYKEEIWKGIIAVIISALKHKRLRSISALHLFVQDTDNASNVKYRERQFRTLWQKLWCRVFSLMTGLSRSRTINPKTIPFWLPDRFCNVL